MSKPKSNMQVPISWSGQDKRFGDSVKENLDVIVGHRGDPLDKAITARDLLESGIATLSSGVNAYGGGTGDLMPPTTLPDLTIPPAPTNLSASGAFQNVLLTWSLQDYAGHAYVEVWRNATNNIATAARLDTTTLNSGAVYADNVGSGQSFYYWVRAVNQNGDVGPYNSSSGTLGQTATDTSVLLDALANSITSSELASSLTTEIDKIDDLETFTGYSSGYSGSSLLTRVGAVETTASGAATSAQLTAESTARTSADTALASDISTLSTTVGNNTSSISTQATSLNGLSAKYTVKTDINGAVAGFGLASTANSSGNITSEFIVNADRFAIMRGGNDTTAATVPFVVQATATTLNGETVSAGVYMAEAFIKNGAITNAKIGNAAIDDAKIANLSAGKITSGTIDTSRLNIDSSSLTSVNGVLQVGNLAANKITSGTLNASNVTITNLYADNITGDINTLIPFSIPSAVQIGGGDTQVWAGQFPAAGTNGKAKKPYVSAVGFGNWENDVVYKVKLQMKPNVSSTTTTVGAITGATSFTIFGYTSYSVQVSGDKQSIVFAGGTLKIGSAVRGTVSSTTYDSTNNRTSIFYIPQNGGFTTSDVGSTLSIQTTNAWQDVSTIMFRADYDDHPEPFAISGGLTTAYSVTVDVRLMFDTYYATSNSLPSTPHNTNWNDDQVFALDGLMMSLR